VTSIETDYLVVGAGAAGLAFTDELIAQTDAEVVMVDRRDRPGGHWNDAYPFVRLHQPSAFYGVNSRTLGSDRIDDDGPNAGYYERATAAEICDYFQAVLDEHLLRSGKVRFLGGCDYQGNGGSSGPQRVESATGEVHDVHVRGKVVDARYLETPIPKTHTPTFRIGDGAAVVPVNDLPAVRARYDRYVVLGGGKTAMDACSWLLDDGVDPAQVQWIRPRDAWILDRAGFQPLEQVASIMEGFSYDLECAAEATSVEDLFLRLERRGRLFRLDENVAPSMYRCAILSRDELTQLRQIHDVVRLGRVVRIDADRIVLEQGSLPTSPETVHIDCTAAGLRTAPARPIFEADRITIQQVRFCSPTFNSALVAYVEATRDDVDEKNRLCPPNPYPTDVGDWIRNMRVTVEAAGRWLQEADLAGWMEQSRLNLTRGLLQHFEDPRMLDALGRFETCREPALAKMATFEQELATATA
jgi:hypothetical protein